MLLWKAGYRGPPTGFNTFLAERLASVRLLKTSAA